MNRRDFVKLLLAEPLAATVDVEQLLWEPKTIVTVPTMPPKAALESWGTGPALQAGDVFTIAGVYAINPNTGLALGQLQVFVAQNADRAIGIQGIDLGKVNPALIQPLGTGAGYRA